MLSGAHSEALNTLSSLIRESASETPMSFANSAVPVSPGSIGPGNFGIQALSVLADSMQNQSQNRNNPIVLGEMLVTDLLIRQHD